MHNTRTMKLKKTKAVKWNSSILLFVPVFLLMYDAKTFSVKKDYCYNFTVSQVICICAQTASEWKFRSVVK